MELKPNFTPRAQEAIINSKKIAEELDKRVISEDHLCLSVSKIQSLSLIDFYSTCGVKAEDLEKFIRKRLKQGANHEKKKPYFSTGFKSILGRSMALSGSCLSLI